MTIPKQIEFRGESASVAEWARRLGITLYAMQYRLSRWPLERALTEAPNRSKRGLFGHRTF